MTDEMTDEPPNAGPALFYTAAEAAGMLRVSQMTISRLIAAGDIDAVRVGRALRIPVAPFDRKYLPASDATTT